MKSKKRQNGGIKKPNMIAIFICLALVLLLFGGGGAAIYNKSSNKLPTEPNYEPGDAFGPFGSDYINHLSNIYHHDEVEVEQDYYMAENENWFSYTYSLNMTPPGINNTQNSDSHQNPTQDSHIHQNPTQDLNQYSQYIDNLCIFSQFCSLTSFDEYIDFMNKLEQ